MKRAWRHFLRVLMAIGHFLGRIHSVLLLSFSFYAILLPISLCRRLIRRTPPDSGWQARHGLPKDHYRKQY